MTKLPVSVGNIISAEEMKAKIKRLEAGKTTIYSGIECIDRTLGFFKLGDIYVISGPTGHGKTTFCQYLITNFSDLGYQCLYLGREGVTVDFFEKFPINKLNFWMSEDFIKNSLKWYEQTILKAIKEKDCNIIFIDHLHYIVDFANLGREGSSIFIGQFMRKLVEITDKHKVLLFLVAHTHKNVIVKAPNLSDVRDSSFVTQEVNGVFMVYRRFIYDKNTGEIEYPDSKCKIAIQKNRRKGLLKTFKMKYINNQFVEDYDE